MSIVELLPADIYNQKPSSKATRPIGPTATAVSATSWS
jgi:hypothetical protein